jgi:hypothetical protein
MAHDELLFLISFLGIGKAGVLAPFFAVFDFGVALAFFAGGVLTSGCSAGGGSGTDGTEAPAVAAGTS